MRLSVEDTDNDSVLLCRSRYITITLDGSPLRGCVTVDEDAGVIDRYVQPLTDDGTGRMKMERLVREGGNPPGRRRALRVRDGLRTPAGQRFLPPATAGA